MSVQEGLQDRPPLRRRGHTARLLPWRQGLPVRLQEIHNLPPFLPHLALAVVEVK
jgi:hypothetical protein